MKKYILGSFLGLLLLQGCSKFDEINDNPNQPSIVRSDLLLNNIAYTAFGEDADLANSTGSYSTFVGGDMGGCWGQHLSKVQYNDEERYLPRVGVVQDFWETYYEDVCNDSRKMYELAGAENNKAVQGAARVLEAYGFSVLTDCYGDIPFSEALKSSDGIFKPTYDAQEDVYVGILALLDEANTLLATGEGSIPASSDKVYGGNILKWQKFANSLKVRCLMRVSGKASSKINVASQLADIVNSRPIFTSNADEAKFAMGAAQPAANPFYETVVFGSRAEWKVNSVLVDMMVNTNDPRLPIYAEKASDGTYRGKPSGFKNLPSAAYGYKNISAIGAKFLKPDAPGFFMSYAELCFFLAEARFRGLISTGSAEDYYVEGIRASLSSHGISSADIATYTAIVAYDPANALKQIGEQKWLSLFGQGIETWTEWRRTKVPALTAAAEAVLTEIPSRYQYPTTEQSLNKANYDAAIARQGADLLTTKLWWLP